MENCGVKLPDLEVVTREKIEKNELDRLLKFKSI